MAIRIIKVTSLNLEHYSDVIMSMMASQITSLLIVYSTLCSGPKKTSKLHVTGLCEVNSPVTGEFPAQRASNVENVSIWWCHHEQPESAMCPYMAKHCQVLGHLHAQLWSNSNHVYTRLTLIEFTSSFQPLNEKECQIKCFQVIVKIKIKYPVVFVLETLPNYLAISQIWNSSQPN